MTDDIILIVHKIKLFIFWSIPSFPCWSRIEYIIILIPSSRNEYRCNIIKINLFWVSAFGFDFIYKIFWSRGTTFVASQRSRHTIGHTRAWLHKFSYAVFYFICEYFHLHLSDHYTQKHKKHNVLSDLMLNKQSYSMSSITINWSVIHVYVGII